MSLYAPWTETTAYATNSNPLLLSQQIKDFLSMRLHAPWAIRGFNKHMKVLHTAKVMSSCLTRHCRSI